MRLLLIPAFRISDLLGELAIQILALVEVGTPERFVLSEREVCSGDNTSRATLRNALAAGESRRFQCLGHYDLAGSRPYYGSTLLPTAWL